MITKQRLLVAVASDIADIAQCSNEIALKAADAALQTIGLHVILPLIEAMDFEARPAYREIVMNQVRDILAKEP